MNELKQQWHSLREAQPRLRIRDAAARHCVPEAALLETRIGDGVLRLDADIRAICPALPSLGTVMSLVRNQAAVHEKDAAFGVATVTDDAICFAGGDFSLDLDPALIAHAYRVDDTNPKGLLRSIQFFDAAGDAAWKIYARDKADHAAFERLVSDLAQAGGETSAAFAPKPLVAMAAAASVTVDLQSILERIAERGLPLCLEVANHAVRQRHCGPIHRIVRMGSWLNVLNPGFDWHLEEGALAGAEIGGGSGAPRLALRLADGGEAAVLALDDRATEDQRTMWHNISEWARQND